MRAFLFFIFIFILSLNAYAEEVEIDLLRGEYESGVTLQAEININSFLYENIKSSQINLFYNDTRINIVPFLAKLDLNEYFVYFNLPTDLNPGIYTILIKDVLFDRNGSLIEENIIKNFSMGLGNNGTYYINPGIIIIDDFDEVHEIIVSNNEDQDLDIGVSSNSKLLYISNTNFTLRGNNVKSFNVEIDELIDKSESNFINVVSRSLEYKIPIFIDVEDNEGAKNETSYGNVNIRFDIGVNKYYDVLLLNDKLENKEIKITNFGDTTSNDIRYNLTGNLEDIIILKNNPISSLQGKKSHNIIIDISGNEVGEYVGEFDILIDGFVVDSLPMEISVVNTEEEREDKIQENEQKNDISFGEVDNSQGKGGIYLVLGYLFVIGVLVAIFFIHKKKINSQDF